MWFLGVFYTTWPAIKNPTYIYQQFWDFLMKPQTIFSQTLVFLLRKEADIFTTILYYLNGCGDFCVLSELFRAFYKKNRMRMLRGALIVILHNLNSCEEFCILFEHFLAFFDQTKFSPRLDFFTTFFMASFSFQNQLFSLFLILRLTLVFDVISSTLG